MSLNEKNQIRTSNGLKVLSLFDGMACGMLALMGAGYEVERYVAYEIDKYAVQTSTHNFPAIEHRGDVFEADFSEFEGFDILCGGSPCTYWSIAQKNNRETEASGMGWELFSQYVRALHEAKPKYFVYENNKSMSKAIRASITEIFGFEPICINSALVSAQNRQRLYWVGKREADGTYSKVDVEQPEDRGILLKDILASGNTWREKSLCIDANYYKGGNMSSPKKQSGQRCMVAEPVCVAQRGRYNENGKVEQHFEAREDNKTNVITTVPKDNMVVEPVNTTTDGKARTIRATCYKDGIRNLVGNDVDRKTAIAEPVYVREIPNHNGKYRNGKQPSQQYRIYSDEGKSTAVTATNNANIAESVCMRYECSQEAKAVRKQYEAGEIKHGFHELSELHPRTDGKTNTVSTVLKDNPICEPIGCAEPCEWDDTGNPTKAISAADGKTYTVYKVENGIITIKGKEYPIKLSDGFYIIRKLTVRECMRLQTVPEWYEFSVSDTQAYKMLGNGWTVEVIKHLFEALPIK